MQTMRLTLVKSPLVTFNSVAQYAHVGWGYLLVTVPTLLIGHKCMWLASVVILGGSAIKEYLDAHGLETPDVAGNSWEDFGFWCVGNAGAVIVLLLKGHP